MKLYHHKTTGGAEYLTDTFIKWEHNGKKGKEGTLTKNTRFIVRIDGDIEKDAELSLKNYICPNCGYNIAGLTMKALRILKVIKDN